LAKQSPVKRRKALSFGIFPSRWGLLRREKHPPRNDITLSVKSVRWSGELSMNKDLFEGKWKQIRTQTTTWWSLFTEHDLAKVDKVPVKFDKYVTMLRVKYGYTSEQAKNEIGKNVAEYEAEQNSAVKPA
jgi:hypothetical protein